MGVQLDRIFQSFAETLDAPPVEDAEIGRGLAALLAALGGFDEVVVFAYRGKDRPIELFSTFAADAYAVFVTLYQAGPYLIDPFYHRALEMRRGVWRMRDIAPDRFFSSEYRRTYYVQTGLAEELGFFLPLGDGVSIVLSLMRREQTGGFSDKEYRAFGQAEPAVAALMRRGWGRMGERFDAAP
ncbi:helix-turn-helix transcriptional regulator, partial [bacterium]